MARPASWLGSRTISWRASTRSIWCARAPRRLAARAAAAAPTWHRPAVRTALRPMPRSRRSKRRSAPDRRSNFNDHAVLGRLEREFAAARQHVGAHVGEDKPFRPNLAEPALERRQDHVRLDRLVAHVGFADEQIGLMTDLDQGVGPLGVAGKTDDLTFRLEAEAETGACAIVVDDVVWRHVDGADLAAAADFQLAQSQREAQLQFVRAGESHLDQLGEARFEPWRS